MAKTIHNSKQSSGLKSMTMVELLAGQKSSFVTLRKGDAITGKITKLTPSEILIDIAAKTDAVVLEKDRKLLKQLLLLLKVGDTVNVTVLNPESDMGYPVVSMRRFLDNILWERLTLLQKEQKPLEVFIDGATRGGFLVSSGGISGFLPNSQVLSGENLQDLVGKKIQAFVLELDRPSRKVIFTQRVSLGVEEFEKITKTLKVEQEIDAKVTNVTPFGIFVSLQIPGKENIDGLVHISEISWDRVVSMEELFSVGQEIKAVIIGFDSRAKRVDLSVKRLKPDPFEKNAEKFSLDQKVSGRISKIFSSGVVIELENEMEGFIRAEKIPSSVSYKVDDQVDATVSQIDKKRRRIILVPILLEKPIGYK